MRFMIIAIDFDGTLAEHAYPAIGDEVEGAIRVCKKLQEAGHRLILYTMRSGEQLEEAVAWCAERELIFWAVNENPQQKEWTNSPKIYAHHYIDDAAIGCPLVPDESERPYVDWDAIELMLFGEDR